MKKILAGFLFAITFPVTSWALPVSVSLEASSVDVLVGETFTIDILADIPDPVLGWGLDLGFDAGLVDQVGAPVIGADWSPFLFGTPDGDGLGGVAPFPSTVFGTDILLASLTFEAISAGSAIFAASSTLFDLTEGFALAFPLFGFADVSFTDTVVTIKNATVPEPSGLLLFSLGLAAFSITRFKSNNT